MKAFISSTFQDLKEYRKFVRDSISEIGVEIIEFSVPSIEPVTELIKKKVKEADLIIFILGYRYGSIDSKSKKSFTEVELNLARSLNKPILVYLAAEDASWPINQIDADLSRINVLREHFLGHYNVRLFSNPSDLAAKVVTDVLRYINRQHDSHEKKKKVSIPTKQVRIVRLLLSSPGDVIGERHRFEHSVFRFNQNAVEQQGIFIKIIRWEDMAPQIGPSPQNVINSQIGNYEMFTGIMWNRFGTPTDIASSGTEEEFQAALDSWKNIRKPWITFYFCDRPVNFTRKEQLEQKEKVINFRTNIEEMGIFKSYTDLDQFEDLVYRDLMRITALTEFHEIIKPKDI